MHSVDWDVHEKWIRSYIFYINIHTFSIYLTSEIVIISQSLNKFGNLKYLLPSNFYLISDKVIQSVTLSFATRCIRLPTRYQTVHQTIYQTSDNLTQQVHSAGNHIYMQHFLDWNTHIRKKRHSVAQFLLMNNHWSIWWNNWTYHWLSWSYKWLDTNNCLLRSRCKIEQINM